MSKIIAVTNQKGGVGKTTTSVNLSASLASIEYSVLLIDLDPQGNATMGSGDFDKQQIENKSINEVLLGSADLVHSIVSALGGYNLLPANSDLTEAEIGLLQMEFREQRLLRAVARVKDRYDFIIIDCPPALNMLTINALVAADSVLIPMQCEYYALEGLSKLLKTIERLCNSVNPKLHIEGILRTMYDSRNCLASQVSEQLFKHFSDKIYQTIIPRNIRLAEAPSHGLPALLYDKYSSGAVAYMALAKEIIARRENELKLVSVAQEEI